MSVLVDSYRFAAPAFTPTDLSGLALWLDASDTATITESGGAVSQWNDKSSNARHFTASGTAKPTTGVNTLNGRNVLNFDGSDDTMTRALFTGSAAAWTIAWVAKASLTSNSGASCSFGDDYQNFAGQMYSSFGKTGRANFTHGVTLTNPHVFVFSSANGDWRAWIDGTSKFTSTVNTAVVDMPMVLANKPGANARWGGDIAEIVIYNSVLSTTDRDTVTAYLQARWGL